MLTLVTGATGFVGSAVARLLLAEGATVRVLARPQSDRRNLAGLDVEVVEGDLRDPASLTRAVADCHTLYHVAADYRLWTPHPQELYATNVDGTRHLLRAAAAADVQRIVYTSSVATLGIHADHTPATEDSPVTLAAMVGDYKRSKYLAEEAVRELVHELSLPLVIVNPSTPVGPGDIKPTPTGRMVRDAALGNMPAYVDTGLNIVHVDDVARGHLLAAEHGRVGERYILGGDDLSMQQVLELVAVCTGRPAPRIQLPRAPLVPLAYCAEAWARLTGGPEPRLTLDALRMSRKLMYFSSAKAERELGYRARPASEALRDAVAWFLAAAADARGSAT